MTTLTGAHRPRTAPNKEPGPSTTITAEGPDYATAYETLQALVPEGRLLIWHHDYAS